MPPSESKASSELGQADRYSRQVALLGKAAQERLAAAHVLIVGCGALGSMQAELAARAGIGKLTLVDRDIVELHNLQRQLLFDEADAAHHTPKAVAAAARLRRINSCITIDDVVADVTAHNIRALLASADLVLDGTDNFDTRYLLNDACVEAGKPWIYGGVVATSGTVLAIRPGGPCFRCLLPEAPDGTALPTCETAGVLGPAVATVAAQQLTLALRLLVGDAPANDRVYVTDLWAGESSAFSLAPRPACPCCAERRFEFLEGERGSRTTTLCGRNAVQVSPEQPLQLDLAELAGRLAALGKVQQSGLVLSVELEGRRLVLFPDGRTLVFGTNDPTVARTLTAKLLGL